ncbi:MAG: Transcriptional regulator, TrmB [Candidatus Moranbacteria bacterium GW2011_GWA2_39_41]|nr:MAG: Transcriptional regulator, TrmB [Candidatus Moranbacteria bacterium GW2011_GWA2_39_41]
MIIEDLIKIGLDKKEAQLYLCLLELGETNLARISQKSNIKRTTCYDIVESLKNKGLISVTTRKKRVYYVAEDPRKMERQLEEKKHVLNSILPQLLSVANFIDKKPAIRYFEGTEGIKDVFRDTLNFPKQEILAWVSEEAVEHFDINWLWNFYVTKRAEKKIWSRSIAPDVPYLKNVKTFDQAHLRQSRLISSKDFPFQVEINLYSNDRIGIMSFREKFGLIIESKQIYTTLKSIFEAHWKSLETKS